MPAYRVDDNGGFRIRYHDVIHHTTHAPVRLAIVIPFFVASSCGWAKTIRIRYVWRGIFSTMDKKISFLKNIPDKCGRGLKVRKTNTRKSLQFGYSSKKRMDGSLKKMFGLPYATEMSRIHRKGPH